MCVFFMTKYIKIAVIFCFAVFLQDIAHASAPSSNLQEYFNGQNPADGNILFDIPGDFLQNIQDIPGEVNEVPLYSMIFSDSMAAYLCDIRRVFCGKFVVTIIAVSIFVAGLLVLNGKMTWTYAIIIISAAVLIVKADSLTGAILAETFGLIDLSIMSELCVCFPQCVVFPNAPGC